MQEEIWKDIEGYEGCYQISNSGRVKSLARRIKSGLKSYKDVEERILKNRKDKYGYYIIGLYKLGVKPKAPLIHRLVAKTFIPNPENKPQVNHINGIKTDNRIKNLEWVTNLENQRHAKDTGLRVNATKKGSDSNLNTKLTEKDVLYIRDSYNENKLSKHLIAEKFNISYDYVNIILKKLTWKHI